MRNATSPSFRIARRHQVLLLLLGAVFVWSYIGCYDRFTWFLEVLPVLIAISILALTYRRFPLTDLAYTLIAIHAIILMVGGHLSTIPFCLRASATLDATTAPGAGRPRTPPAPVAGDTHREPGCRI